MNKKFFLFFALISIFSLKVLSQTFTYRTSLKTMCGDPGDIFACTISFTNTSGSPIDIYVDRYQKTMPAYWFSCFCYMVCNSPLRDTITINIPAFSTDMMVVQFKTDSVNPGISYSDFKLYQVGFQNNVDSFQLEATTVCNISMGINEPSKYNSNFNLFPNPTDDNISVFLIDENIEEIKIYDIVGQLKERIVSKDLKDQNINVNGYENGVYIFELYTNKGRYKKRFIKK